MSTDRGGAVSSATAGVHAGGRRAARAKRARRRFAASLAAVIGVLAVLVGVGSAVSLTSGPRISEVEVDPAAAIDTSGSRAILTANQALAAIDAAQVTVEPAVPHTIDAAGRSIGVRFTSPLDDDTEYRIVVSGVRGVGGGPVATLETSFRTPPARVLMLERGDGDDVIYLAGLDGGEREVLFRHPEIDDFRAASGAIVVSVRESDGQGSLIRLDANGRNPAPFTLPGEGILANLQISERGGMIGYTYTDLPEPGAEPEREAQLFTASLRDPAAEPEPVEVAGEAPSVGQWQFVPDSTALLLIDFESELVLVEPDADPGLLGTALAIDAIARGTYTAIVERIDGLVWIDLETGDEQPIAEPVPSPGLLGQVMPLPAVPGAVEDAVQEGAGGDESAGGQAVGDGVDTVRQYGILDEDGIPQAQSVMHVSAAGEAREIVTVAVPEVLLDTCLSPSGRYVAALVAPDQVDNPYDTMPQPMPQAVETRIVDIGTGEQVATLPGFDISWCQAGPW